MVYFVGSAARFVITTSEREIIAPMISLNTAPLNRIAAIVSGKNTADIAVIEIPTQAMRFFSSLFNQVKKRAVADLRLVPIGY